jgi:hypothetical protein
MNRIFRIRNKNVFRLSPKPFMLFIMSIPVNFVFEGFTGFSSAQPYFVVLCASVALWQI